MTGPEIDAAAREAARPFAASLAELVYRETGREVPGIGEAIANAGRAVLTAVEPLIRADERASLLCLLDQAEDVMHGLSLRLIGISVHLKEPFTDMPGHSLWSMTFGPLARRAHDTSIAIRKHLGIPYRPASRALGMPPIEIEDVVTGAVAAERERIAKLAAEVGATVSTCPCQPEKGIGDPAHVGGRPAPFADVIREAAT